MTGIPNYPTVKISKLKLVSYSLLPEQERNEKKLNNFVLIKSKKVEQSHYRPRQALRVPGVCRSQISTRSMHEDGNVVSPKHWPALPPGNIPGTHFCYRLSKTQGHSTAGKIISMKNSNDTIRNQNRDLPAQTYSTAVAVEHHSNSSATLCICAHHVQN